MKIFLDQRWSILGATALLNADQLAQRPKASMVANQSLCSRALLGFDQGDKDFARNQELLMLLWGSDLCRSPSSKVCWWGQRRPNELTDGNRWVAFNAEAPLREGKKPLYDDEGYAGLMSYEGNRWTAYNTTQGSYDNRPGRELSTQPRPKESGQLDDVQDAERHYLLRQDGVGGADADVGWRRWTTTGWHSEVTAKPKNTYDCMFMYVIHTYGYAHVRTYAHIFRW